MKITDFSELPAFFANPMIEMINSEYESEQTRCAFACMGHAQDDIDGAFNLFFGLREVCGATKEQIANVEKALDQIEDYNTGRL